MKTKAIAGVAAALALLALAAFVLPVLAPGPAVASQGHGKAKGRTAATAAVVMSVSPDPVPAGGAIYSVSGSGFTPGAQVGFVLDGGVATFVVAGASGVASTTFQSGAPTTSTIHAYEFNGKSLVLAGSTTFSVV